MKGLPRLKRASLPAELLDRNSDLDRSLILVGDLYLADPDKYQPLVNKTHTLVKAHCMHFKPASDTPLMCRSGEEGKSYNGHACGQCILGRFSADMKHFTGPEVKRRVYAVPATEGLDPEVVVELLAPGQ